MFESVNKISQSNEIKREYTRCQIFKRIMSYNRPRPVIALAIITSIISAGVFPFFGILTIKMAFALMTPKDNLW